MICVPEMGLPRKFAQRHEVSRVMLYQWRKQLLGKEQNIAMQKEPTSLSAIANHGETDPAIRKLIEEKSILEKQVDDLKKSVNRLQLERDILEKAAALLKKDEGINLNAVSNREKSRNH